MYVHHVTVCISSIQKVESFHEYITSPVQILLVLYSYHFVEGIEGALLLCRCTKKGTVTL